MNQRRLRKLQEVRRHASYTQLYYDLVRLWGQEVIWAAVLTAFVVMMLMAVWSVDFASVTPAEFPVVVEAIVRALIILVIPGLLFYLATAYSKDPVTEVPLLAVYIITALPRPYTQQRGLGYRQIRHLMDVARIEQSAADWRGSFVSVIILGVLSLGVALGLSFLRDSVSNLLGLPSAESGFPWRNSWFLRSIESDWYQLMSTLGLILIGLWLGFTLLEYTRRFLGTEPANRILLMAGEDALAFLEEHGLTESETFSLREKKAIAAHFRCRLVAAEDASRYDRLGMRGHEPSGMLWYLHPPAQYSRLERARLTALRARNRFLRNHRQSEDKGDK